MDQTGVDTKPKLSRRVLVFLGLFCVVTVVLCIFFWPFVQKLRDPVYREGFSRWVKLQGARGVLFLFGIQILQIIVAVIPGEPVEFIAGAAYGALYGLILCLAGCMIASSFIFALVRKAGLPLIIRFFGQEKLNRYVFLQDTRKTALVVFVIFLIPGTPKDMLSYVVPLSSLKLRAFVIITAFARIPSILSSTIMGDSVIKGNWGMFALVLLLIAALGLSGILFTERILGFLRRKTKT
ncbi:MAG: VTT domain-containing protein [Treponema sp.]|jgi:uncharacterized membrane protein YdjX (TVP38/TMEM64 family)|nr:VTT domain-containing protein [Treponema sp.]